MKKKLFTFSFLPLILGCKKDDSQVGNINSIVGTWDVTSINIKTFDTNYIQTKDTTLYHPFKNGNFESFRFTKDSLYIKEVNELKETKGLEYVKTDTSLSFKNYGGMIISYKIDNFSSFNLDFSFRKIPIVHPDSPETTLGYIDQIYKSKRK